MRSWLRLEVGGAAALLFVIAAYHGSGYGEIRALVGGSSLPEGVHGLFGGLWLFFSWHIAALGLAALLIAISGSPRLRPVLLFCGAVALADFFWVFSLSGWFAGTALLLVAALGLLVGGLLWRAEGGPAMGGGR